MRAQIKRDREAKTRTIKKQPTAERNAFQLVLGSSGDAANPPLGAAAGGGGAAGGGAAGARALADPLSATGRPAAHVGAPARDGDADTVVAAPEPGVRRALEQAFPGTRLLSEAERRVAAESLARRQAEVRSLHTSLGRPPLLTSLGATWQVVTTVQESQLVGEAGRQLLNDAQRELIELNRLRGCVAKRFVLVRTDREADAAGGVGASLAPGGQIGGTSSLPYRPWPLPTRSPHPVPPLV